VRYGHGPAGASHDPRPHGMITRTSRDLIVAGVIVVTLVLTLLVRSCVESQSTP
jgi:hypothetical protein